MKSISLTALSLLIITLLIAVFPTEAEGAVYEDTLRLHILANSDSKEDQDLKIKLRDSILIEYSSIFSEVCDTDEAYRILLSKTDEIKEFSENMINSLGYSYAIEVALSREWYETREYEEFTLPRGYYPSLRIIIGSGEGKNWWCVMFPPLCLDIATESAPEDDAIGKYSESEISLIKGSKGYRAKFKILELISGVFG